MAKTLGSLMCFTAVLCSWGCGNYISNPVIEEDPNRAANVTARYVAPVSRWATPKAAARFRAAVLFPDPAGPSIVTIMRTLYRIGGVRGSRGTREQPSACR